jgi:hypothetical protein
VIILLDILIGFCLIFGLNKGSSSACKRRTGPFVRKGRQRVNGGACLVSWDIIQRPPELGGLGILKLEYLSWALQVHWLWLLKTGAAHAWKGLQILVHSNAIALFSIAVSTVVGNGGSTLFWTDGWFMGNSLAEMAPLVLEAVPSRIKKTRLVAEALAEQGWISHIQGSLSMVGLY